MIKFIKDGKNLACIEVSNDVGIYDLGFSISSFLENASFINGITRPDIYKYSSFNGISDFAIQLLTYLKIQQAEEASKDYPNTVISIIPGRYYFTILSKAKFPVYVYEFSYDSTFNFLEIKVLAGKKKLFFGNSIEFRKFLNF